MFLTPDTTLIRGLVAQRTTLEAMLRDHGFAADDVGTVVKAARRVFDPRRLRSSQPFLLERTLEGGLRHFEYEIDADSYLRVAPSVPGAGVLRADVLPIPKTLEHAVAAGTIDESTPSLFQAMAATGEGAELTIALAQIFTGEIDFNVCAGRPVGGARGSGPDGRDGRLDRPRHRAAPPLRTAEKRHVGRSASRTSQHAARRTGARRRRGGLPRCAG